MNFSSAKADLFAKAELIGDAPEISEVRLRGLRASRTHHPVLILGEPGSGKETLARLIHQKSSRGAMPFLPVDCAGMDEKLLERELFGSSTGYSQGIEHNSLGAFRCSQGGSIFLDEISELAPCLQKKISDAISAGYTVPIGDYRPNPLDSRFICASNRSIQEMVSEGTFDREFFAQISVIVIEMPALRERRQDILFLADHFLKLQSYLYSEPGKSISPEAAALLERCSWPGNVRELFGVMEQAHVLADGGEITPDDLPPQLRYLG